MFKNQILFDIIICAMWLLVTALLVILIVIYFWPSREPLINDNPNFNISALENTAKFIPIFTVSSLHKLTGYLDAIFTDLGASVGVVDHFRTKREKAQFIYNWFQTNPDPSFTKYKRDMSHDPTFASNVVEYEDVLKLVQDRNLTVESVEKKI